MTFPLPSNNLFALWKVWITINQIVLPISQRMANISSYIKNLHEYSNYSYIYLARLIG